VPRIQGSQTLPQGARPLGEHSREVLRDFGLPAARIDALVAAGVVQCA